MDDATEGLTQLSVWSSDFYTQSNGVAGSIAAALLGVALDLCGMGTGHEEGECPELPAGLDCLRDIYRVIHLIRPLL